MPFTLDNAVTGLLGGQDTAIIETTCEDRGQGLTLDWTQSGNDQDFESYGYSVRFHPAEQVPYDAQSFDASQVVRTPYGVGLYGVGPYGGLTLGSGSGVGGIFVLDVSTLGSLLVSLTDIPIEDRGRSIQLDWTQSGLDQDMELFGYSIRFAPAEKHAVEVP